MKRTIAILLFFVFTFNIAGVIVVFKLQQFSIRREIKRQIKRGVSDEELHVIIVNTENSEELSWQKENEFIYKGAMYDIVKKETLADSSIAYYCINDKQETELFAHLDELIRKDMDHRSPVGKTAKKLFQVLSSIFPNEQLALPLHSSKPVLLNNSYINNYSTPDISLSSPPPRSVF
ncbi:MAG: hypothetical protein L6Q66_07415 [Bacteroidia bacterium]|nr:hypothetical protein [Bacteroidia bacterium]